MSVQRIPYSEFGLGSKLINDLIAKNSNVVPLVSNFYSIDNLILQTNQVKKSGEHRQKLVQVLIRQNKMLNLSEPSKKNINDLANQNTFTVTTGHQLNLLTGPLFSIYKIAQTISICKALNSQDNTKNYVPVFWMATEDHDYDEINHLYLFGKKFEHQKSNQTEVISGALHTEGLDTLFEEIKSLYREDEVKLILTKLFDAYTKTSNWADATRQLINHLFGEFGLVIIDGNDAELKRFMAPVFVQDVENKLTETEVNKTNQLLESLNYHQQVHLRDCNLFFIHPNSKRERIVREGDNFIFNNGSSSLTQLVALINESPEKFSPNALLRPVYQEIVLPNIAYVGGGGEIAYWLQLKGVFNKLAVPFPLLRVRDSFITITQKELDDSVELGLNLNELNVSVDVLAKQVLLTKSGDELSLAESKASLDGVRKSVLEKASKVDKNLVTMVEAEFTKMNGALEKIEAKIVKAEKQKDVLLLKKIEKLKNKIYPNGIFQERHENFIPNYLKTTQFINQLIDAVGHEESPTVQVLIL